jgi:hypothetical protein
MESLKHIAKIMDNFAMFALAACVSPLIAALFTGKTYAEEQTAIAVWALAFYVAIEFAVIRFLAQAVDATRLIANEEQEEAAKKARAEQDKKYLVYYRRATLVVLRQALKEFACQLNRAGSKEPEDIQ